MGENAEARAGLTALMVQVAELRVEGRYTAQAASAAHQRVTSVEARVGHLESRQQALEARQEMTSGTKPESSSETDKRRQALMDGLRYAGAILIVVTAASGKLSPDLTKAGLGLFGLR